VGKSIGEVTEPESFGSRPNTIMVDKTKIREHLEVIGSDGQHVGLVDHLDGESIKLAKNDAMAGGEHHWLPLDLVQSVDGDMIKLSVSGSQAQRSWSRASLA
jgi:hypothetical protein